MCKIFCIKYRLRNNSSTLLSHRGQTLVTEDASDEDVTESF